MTWSVPIILTLARIAVIPVVLVLMLWGGDTAGHIAAVLFAIAAFTDWLDGFLARRWRQTSAFGAFLDPVADKLLVAASLIMVLHERLSGPLALLVVIIISREITISALREWLAEVGQRTRVAVNYIGKVKTMAQMAAITLMLWETPLFGWPTYAIGFFLLVIAAGLTVWSMIVYLRLAWPIMLGRE